MKNKGNQGSALIYTLFIMSLLTLITFSFLLSSNNALKESDVVANNIDVTYTLENTSNKVKGILQFLFLNNNQEYKISPETISPALPYLSKSEYNFFAKEHDSSDISQNVLYSSNPDPNFYLPTEEKESILESLGGLKNFVPKRRGRRCDNPCTKPTQCYWHNLFTKLSWENNIIDNKLTSRYLYIIVNKTGCINPYVINADSTEKNKDISALNLKDFYYKRGEISDADIAKIKNNEDADLPWLSQENMIRTTDISSAYPQILFPYTTKEPDAFWIDKGDEDGIPNNKLDDDELYARFNMNLSDEQWDKMEVDSLLAQPAIYKETTGDAPVANNAGGIDWLHNWKNINYWEKQGKDVSELDIERKQIAANIIDMFDTNSEPTIDTANPPKYMGIEKTPFINELMVRHLPYIYFTSWSSFYMYVYRGLYVEIINPWNENMNKTCRVEVEGDISFDVYQNNTKIIDNHKISLNRNTTFTGPDKKSYLNRWFGNWQQGWIFSNKPVSGNRDLSLRNYATNIKKISLFYDGKLVDISYPDKSSERSRTVNWPRHQVTKPDTSYNVIGKWYHFSYQVNDPMVNLNPDDWPQAYCKRDTYPSGAGNRDGSLGEDNYGVRCSSWSRDHDYESDSTPTNYNSIIEAGKYGFDQGTKHIDEYGMTLLGAVHRGEPWTTLNLRHYNDTTVDSPNNQELTRGGGEYRDGDSNILDQITMRSDNNSEVYKLNVNTANYATLQGAFAESGETSHTLTVNRRAGGSQWSGEKDVPFLRRSEMAKSASFSQGDYDWEKEIQLPKYFNYFSTRYNYFTVFTIAQAVKDRDGDGLFDDKIDSITAEKMQKLVYRRDTWTNEIKELSCEYID